MKPHAVRTAAGCLESPVVFDCHGEALLGVLAQPDVTGGAPNASDLGVLIVVGGPQYRAGSHRQFVMLARALAAAGVPALRFDNRGMGDSTGALRSFEALDDDIAAAIDTLLRLQPQLRRVVLWGLCDGASAALLYLNATGDRRVAGLALLNPWVRSPSTLAKAQVKHYYRERLMQRDFWTKLLRGGVAGQALRDLLGNLKLATRSTRAAGPGGSSSAPEPFQQRMARAWAGFGGPVLLMLSERDATAQEFGEACTSDPAWIQALSRRAPQRVLLPGADHTCSDPRAQQAAEAATLLWLRMQLAGTGQAA